jgi:hypothetical protein
MHDETTDIKTGKHSICAQVTPYTWAAKMALKTSRKVAKKCQKVPLCQARNRPSVLSPQPYWSVDNGQRVVPCWRCVRDDAPNEPISA